MEFRKIFDSIPGKFDQYRPCYCKEAFDYLIHFAEIDQIKSVLEIGLGTGQATEPLLRTGCRYVGIELGEHLAAIAKEKFKAYPNCKIMIDDFETHLFPEQAFDVVFSAATIQWIPEPIAFGKSYQLLKHGGTLAMMMLHGDYKTPNEALFNDIQQVYAAHFKPEIPYTQRMTYQNALNYGFVDFQTQLFDSTREYTADEYVQYIGTHCDHICLDPAHAAAFYDGIHNAIIKHGNKIIFKDTVVLHLARKP